MKALRILTTWGVLYLTLLLPAEESKPVTIVRKIKERGERGTLSDQRQSVRGDTGKWSDAAILLHAPPILRKPKGMSLDDWAEQLGKEAYVATAADDNWLICRSRQLDDNDRVWVEKIERCGNEFTVTMSEAIWQGRYNKTFTYYEVLAVSLGKLAPGKYVAKWVVKPVEFSRFEDPGQPKDNWPKDERPSNGKEVELQVGFSVR